MSQKLNVVFDLDDTLVPYLCRFSLAGCGSALAILEALEREAISGSPEWMEVRLMLASFRCARTIIEAVGNDPPHVLAILKKAHGLANFGPAVFNPRKFQQSWVRTYELLCEEVDQHVDDQVCAKLRQLTNKFGRQPYLRIAASLKITEAMTLYYGIDLVSQQNQVDVFLLENHQTGWQRFIESWLVVYRHLCSCRGCEPDQRVIRRIQRANNCLHHGPFRAFSEAIDVLNRIKGMGHRLYLLTMGDKHLQRRKIKQAGLMLFFRERVHVVESDKTPTLREIANGKPQQTIMIGDSLRIDVAAAVAVGARAVLVTKRGHWHYDHDFKIDPATYTRIKSLQHLPDFIIGLSQNGAHQELKEEIISD